MKRCDPEKISRKIVTAEKTGEEQEEEEEEEEEATTAAAADDEKEGKGEKTKKGKS